MLFKIYNQMNIHHIGTRATKCDCAKTKMFFILFHTLNGFWCHPVMHTLLYVAEAIQLLYPSIDIDSTYLSTSYTQSFQTIAVRILLVPINSPGIHFSGMVLKTEINISRDRPP